MENLKNVPLHLGRLFSVLLVVSFTFPMSLILTGGSNLSVHPAAGVGLVPTQLTAPDTDHVFFPIVATGTPQAAAAGSHQVFLPVIARTAPNTILGAYLDSKSSDHGMGVMSSAGASWSHIPYRWSIVETQEGVRNWTAAKRPETDLLASAANHLTPILYINDTPGWALKAGYSCGAVAQDKFSAMALFLADLVKRYSAAPFNVHYYELWSEPDAAATLGCWGDTQDTAYYGGGYYGEMLKVAYPAIKAADPKAQVLFGGLLLDCDPDHIAYCTGNADPGLRLSAARFFEGALADGAGADFDGVTFHAYDYYEGSLGAYYNPNWGASWDTTGPVALVKAAYLHSVLSRYGASGKIILNTEFGLLCGRTGDESYCTTADHTATMSSYIEQAYIGAVTQDLRSLIWFSVAGWRGTALIDPQMNPSPAYLAFKRVGDILVQYDSVLPVTGYAGVEGYDFNVHGRHLWVLWSTTATGSPHTITLNSQPLSVQDMYGAALPAGITQDIGMTPVFIQFSL